MTVNAHAPMGARITAHDAGTAYGSSFNGKTERTPRQRDTSPRQTLHESARRSLKLKSFASAHPVRCVSPVTTTDGRSPGSRVTASWSPSQIPGDPVANDTRLAAYSCGGSCGVGKIPAPHSLFISKKREPSGITLGLRSAHCQAAAPCPRANRGAVAKCPAARYSLDALASFGAAVAFACSACARFSPATSFLASASVAARNSAMASSSLPSSRKTRPRLLCAQL
jgi:hypothetical protein